MMGMRHSAIAALGMMGAVLLAACATRQVAPPPAVVVLPPPPPPAPPPRLAPLDTHRFEILSTDDVVGQVQLVVVGKDDTLPDIARRFNVGYEEIVRANPGVDPWLPGEGREVEEECEEGREAWRKKTGGEGGGRGGGERLGKRGHGLGGVALAAALQKKPVGQGELVFAGEEPNEPALDGTD